MTPSCIAAMKRGGSAVMRWNGTRPPVPLLGELLHPRPPHRDERVLGCDEEPVQQNENADSREFEDQRHAPAPGALVLRGSASTTEVFNWGEYR